MLKKKFIYSCPKTSIIVLDSEIMETTPWSPNPGPADAKEQKIEVIEEQEEELPIDKNIWEDDEE